LSTSFEITELEGHTSFKWTPRAYAGQSDLGGGVSGGQASLYSRARVTLDNSLPLIDRIYPLKTTSDPELVSSFRSILRTTLRTIVEELGIEGGPRVTRVDSLFVQLSGNVLKDGTYDLAHSQLGEFKDELGLDESLVNTLEQESNLTDFISLQDYVVSIRASWDTFKKGLIKGKDLGTRFVLMARSLSVVSESVEEIYAAMDSVFVGDAERQVASFTVDGNEVIVGELLSWIADFATNEAPDLIYQGGRLGVSSVAQTALVLTDQAQALLDAVESEDPATIPDAMRHPRVVQPIKDLCGYLNQTVTFANQAKSKIA
jgi:hypothetical protein